MSSVFRFKQFTVSQENCAMKINTDGVLSGAIAEAENPKKILDIGAGTGVIALMLAQRFLDAQVEAVEIDLASAHTARQNFQNSPFADRLALHPTSIADFWSQTKYQQFDLIVSNPPFYLDTLASPKQNKTLAKHAVPQFFKNLIENIPDFLTQTGSFWIISPLKTALVVKELAARDLFLQHEIAVTSFKHDLPHRYLLSFGLIETKTRQDSFTIYADQKVYSEAYRELLKDFLTIF